MHYSRKGDKQVCRFSKLKQYWMERKQEKLLRNMEDQQSGVQ